MRLMVFVLKAPPPDWRTDDDEAKDRVDMQSPRQFNYSTFRQIARPPACPDRRMSPKVVPNEKLQNWMLGTGGSLFGFAPSLSTCLPSGRDIKGVIWAFWPREGRKRAGCGSEGKWKERKRGEGE